MKLTPYIYCLAVLGLIKPGFARPTVRTQSMQALSDGLVSMTMDQEEVLFNLFRIDEETSTPQQQDMVYRIMDEDSDCAEVKMLCQVDTFLRNLAKDLLHNGVSKIPSQVDMDKFEQLLSRVLSLLDEEDLVDRFSGVNPAILTQAIEELNSKGEKGSDYEAYNKLAFEFENLLINHQDFTPSAIVGPFIISDMELKQDAIERLVNGRALQLKPLYQYGKFYEIKKQIENALKSKNEIKQSQTLVIPLDSMLKQAALLPDLSEQDIVDATIAIDESNAALMEIVNIEEIMMINQIFRSLIGDLLGVILDLPGKLLGTGGKGSKKGGSGISITIDIGDVGGGEGDDVSYDDEEDEPQPKKKQPKPTKSAKRKPAPTIAMSE